MLAIRMQRTGRSGHAQFRVIVQDSHFSPKSGRIVAYVGNYDPHTKLARLDKDKISSYLSGGAQPSDRVAKLLKKQDIKLPTWVKLAPQKQRTPKKAKKDTVAAPAATEPTDTPPTAESEQQTAEQTSEDAPAAKDSPDETTPAEPAAEATPAPAESETAERS